MNIVQSLILLSALLISTVNAVMAGIAPLKYQNTALQLDNKAYLMRVPRGYAIELLTELESPRLITVIENGDLLIGSKSGNIYRIPPPYTSPEVLLTLNDYPHSVALRKNELLIARTNGLYKVPYQQGQKKIRSRNVKMLAALPGGRGHNSRTVAVGPDDRIYMSLGITGNCSDQYLDKSYPFYDRRGGVLVLNESGGKVEWETFGSGLRNPVGYDWHPVTGVMYASNNGPDHLGYELPPEYFSRVTPDSFHGMPWFQYSGSKIIRDDCIDSKPPRSIDEVSVPAATFPARNAPMGVSFVPGGAMDKSLEHNAIVALRGSWGTKPGGSYMGDSATRRHPKLVAVRFENGRAVRVDELVTGFQLDNGKRLARPVGVAIGIDGALYFTSDSGKHGLYRLRKIK